MNSALPQTSTGVPPEAFKQHSLASQVARASLLLDLPQRAMALEEDAFLREVVARSLQLIGSDWGGCLLTCHDDSPRECLSAPPSSMQREAWQAASQIAGQALADAATPSAGGPEAAPLLTAAVLEGGHRRLLLALSLPASPDRDFASETLQLIANAAWRLVHERRSEQALQMAMQVVNASPVVCFRWAARDGWPVVFVSDNVAQWGYAAGRLIAGDPPFAALVHPDDLERVAAEVTRLTAAGMAQYEQEYRLVTADQRVIWVLDRTIVQRQPDGQVAYYDGVLTDITERKEQQLLQARNLHDQQQLNKRLEEANNQLLQSEKMASIGQLAAGVAHELNNPIGFVHSNLGTLEGYLHDLMAVIDVLENATTDVDPATREGIERAKQAHDFEYLKDDIFSLITESRDGLARLRKIVLDLKNFARTGEQEWQPADLQQGLESTLNIVWNELKYKCEVIRDYGELPPVECLISQLNQVFMNLLVNAGQAIPERGTITLRTRCLDEETVCIEVSDTGEGIPPDRLNRIFEPFFTTKPVGTGTGLGLSVSYSIVQRHHGRIEVTSQPGAGTTFRIILPVRQPQ